MNANLEIAQNTVYFFIREKLWRHVQTYCQEQYKKLNDPFFVFWKAFGLYKELGATEAINELTIIQNKKEIQYAAIVALIYFHQQCKMIDREALEDLKQSEYDSRKLSGDRPKIIAAFFYAFLDEQSRAVDVLDSISSNSPISISAKGWMEILQGQEDTIKNALNIFTNLLNQDSGAKTLEALMGKAKSSELQKKFTITLEALNEIVVMFPKFLPALVEKSKVLMMIGDWDQSLDTAQRVLQFEENNLLVLKIQVFHFLAREGNVDTTCEKLSEIMKVIDQLEPKNTEFMCGLSKLFARICGRNMRIIDYTMKLINKCRKLNPLEADYALELATQYLMIDDHENAYNYFQEAAALDESKIESLSGMIHARILQGVIEDAEKQLEFVIEIQSGTGRTPEIAYLQALLASRKEYSKDEQDLRIATNVKFVDEALKMHISFTKTLIPGFDFYIKLDPNFLLSLSLEYLQYVSMDQIVQGKENSLAYISRGIKLLESITKQIPGLAVAHLLQAKGKMSLGDSSGALKCIERCLESEPSNEEANIMYALISSRAGNMSGAYSSLQQAISNNFGIRENPMFMLIKGEIEYKSGDYETALATMEATYELPGIKNKAAPGALKKKATGPVNPIKGLPAGSTIKVLNFTDKDRCRTFLLLAKCLSQNKRSSEAKDIINKSIAEFAGTPEEVSVLIANSEIAIESGDLKKALSILRAVSPQSPYFVESRKIMADVYLNQLMDRRHYAKCYSDLIDQYPTFENYKLLGDALMRIQEPEDAIKAYERALDINSKDKDEGIVRDIGKALVMNHNYERAVEYYENALIRDHKRLDLKLDLGKLLIKLRKFKRAQELLTIETFTDEYSSPNLEGLRRNVDRLLTVARMEMKQQGLQNFTKNDKIKYALEKAIKAQADVIEKCKTEGGNIENEKKYVADLYYELAKYTSNYDRDDERCVSLLEKGLKYNQENEKVLGYLAEMALKTGDRAACESKCLTLLKINPANETASFLLSELLLQKDEPSKAVVQFQKILEEKPSNYGILSKLIEFMRRAGQLNEVKAILDSSQQRASNPNEPGLCFCKGLYFKYIRQIQDALKMFNKAKRSPTFSEDSIWHMIDIYLNPDQEMYFSAADESSVRYVDADGIKMSEQLLRELQSRGSSKTTVMEAYILMLNKQQKNGVDLAINKLGDVLKFQQENVPALFALSVAKFISKKPTDAKNHLKILSKKPFSSDCAEDLERAWLHFADTFIAISKFDEAEALLKKCLKYNQTCGKAEEFMGLIKEKEQSYKDAADHYERAWKLTNQKAASIGFRLAFNYLKAKRYVEAIDVSKKIMEQFPDNQKLDKEILQKAVQALKGSNL